MKGYGYIHRWAKDIFGKRWGFERSCIVVGDVPYMDRWIVYIANRTIRLHKFYRGDDPVAPHDHPWDFWTFPLVGYKERVFRYDLQYRGHLQDVKPFRFHFREAEHRHIVIGRSDGKEKPFYTLVFTGQIRNMWGFWPKELEFVPWRQWSPISDHVANQVEAAASGRTKAKAA